MKITADDIKSFVLAIIVGLIILAIAILLIPPPPPGLL